MSTTISRILNGCGLALALVAVLLLAVGPIGWRMGWWSYSLAFSSLMPWAAYVGVAGAIVAAAGLAVAFSSRRAWSLPLAALVLALIAVYMPFQASNLRGRYPPINDITTDVADPPAFVAALPLRKADGGTDGRYKPESGVAQAKSYPQILPLKLELAPAAAFVRAGETAAAMPGWRLTAQDMAGYRIEAAQSSRWFGFTDDIVIRVRPEGEGSRIDVRSASRHGRGDFGVNAARVQAYLAALSARIRG